MRMQANAVRAFDYIARRARRNNTRVMKPGFQRETEPSRVSSNPYCMLEVGKESNMPPKSKKLHSGRLIRKSGATELAASQTFCSSVMFIVGSYDGHPQFQGSCSLHAGGGC